MTKRTQANKAELLMFDSEVLNSIRAYGAKKGIHDIQTTLQILIAIGWDVSKFCDRDGTPNPIWESVKAGTPETTHH